MDEKREFTKIVSCYGVPLVEYAETLKEGEIQLVYNNNIVLVNCNKYKLQCKTHYVCIYVLMYMAT